MRLPKITLEEAFVPPAGAEQMRSMPADALKAMCYQNGVTPEFMLAGAARLDEFDELRLGEMDAYDITHQILSLCATHSIEQIVDPEAAVAEARRVNDFLAGQVARHPDRYSGFASVALQAPDQAVAELDRAVRELGFKGALINGYANTPDPGRGLYLDDPSLDVFWAAVEDLGVPVYLHPRVNLFGGKGVYAGHQEMLGHVFGFATETAAHVLRVVFSGVFDRHPRAKLIIGHMGEGLPAVLGRIQYTFGLTPQDKHIERPLAEYFGTNILFTTSGNFSDQALIAAILTVGADAILFSVDYPWAQTSVAAPWIERAPISETDRRKIARGNAETLFGLPVQS
jgi:2,3-dihydroxybenzoate decarboxylase